MWQESWKRSCVFIKRKMKRQVGLLIKHLLIYFKSIIIKDLIVIRKCYCY